MNLLRLALLATSAVTATAAAGIDLPIALQNSYRVVSVQLGTPAKEYKLLYDTGSSSAWVLDGECADSCGNVSGFKRVSYNMDGQGNPVSSTGKLLGPVSTIDYSGGFVTGVAVQDQISLGTPATVANATFLAVSSSTWTALGADGFMGLASSSIAQVSTKTVFDSLLEEDQELEPRFGIYQGSAVDNVANNSPENNGVLTLGGDKREVYADGEVRFLKAQTPFEVYKLPLVNVTMTNPAKNSSVPSTFTWDSDVVFDTGASTITVPEGFIEEIYAMTPWSYQTFFHGVRPLCSEFNSSWSFTLNLGVSGGAEESFTVTGDQLRSPGFQDDDHCFPPFNSWDSRNIIVGSQWLQNWYSVFDFGNREQSEVRVGFAPLKKEYQSKYPGDA